MTRARGIEAHDPGALARPDYLDTIQYAGERGRTSEDWARATFEGAPWPVPQVLRLGWKRGLGLRLGPYPATGHVLGWPVFESAADRTVLGVESAVLGHCRLVFETGPDGLLLTTAIRYGKRVSRPVWTVVAPLHRLVTRLLVTRAGHARQHRG